MPCRRGGDVDGDEASGGDGQLGPDGKNPGPASGDGPPGPSDDKPPRGQPDAPDSPPKDDKSDGAKDTNNSDPDKDKPKDENKDGDKDKDNDKDKNERNENKDKDDDGRDNGGDQARPDTPPPLTPPPGNGRTRTLTVPLTPDLDVEMVVPDNGIPRDIGINFNEDSDSGPPRSSTFDFTGGGGGPGMGPGGGGTAVPMGAPPLTPAGPPSPLFGENTYVPPLTPLGPPHRPPPIHIPPGTLDPSAPFLPGHEHLRNPRAQHVLVDPDPALTANPFLPPLTATIAHDWFRPWDEPARRDSSRIEEWLGGVEPQIKTKPVVAPDYPRSPGAYISKYTWAELDEKARAGGLGIEVDPLVSPLVDMTGVERIILGDKEEGRVVEERGLGEGADMLTVDGHLERPIVRCRPFFHCIIRLVHSAYFTFSTGLG